MPKKAATVLTIIAIALMIGCKSKKVLSDKEQTILDQDLCMAAFDNNFDKVYEFIQRGANVNTAKCGSDMSPLFLAILGGAPDLGRSYNLSRDMAREQVIDALIEAGANVNAKPNGGMTALIFAQHVDTNKILVDKLLKAGADPNARDNNGLTAADWANRDNEQTKRASVYKALYSYEVMQITQERKKEQIKKKVESEK